MEAKLIYIKFHLSGSVFRLETQEIIVEEKEKVYQLYERIYRTTQLKKTYLNKT